MKVYPIGYSAYGAEKYIDKLLQQPRTLLIDTRLKPYSWRVSWRQAELRAKYRDRYRWAGGFLGNLNYQGGPIRLVNPDDGIRGLEMYLEEGYDLILLCQCATFADCHVREICRLLVEKMPAIEVVKFDQIQWSRSQSDVISCFSTRPPYGTWLANPQKFLEAGIIPKTIENRDKDFTAGYRGPVLIHQSKTFEQDAIGYWMANCPNLGNGMLGNAFSVEKRDYPLGAIVGIADLVNVVEDADDPWFCGRYGLVLANARPIEPVPWKGELGLFPVPRSVLEQKSRV